MTAKSIENARTAIKNLYLPTRAMNMPADQHELMARSRDTLAELIGTAESLALENKNLRDELASGSRIATDKPEATQ